MVASPLALLRGSAPLFYELLARHPALSEGPAGDGWIVGDAHLENFGAYRAGALKISETRESHEKESVVFDLNDFDDGVVGPWRFDVLRLLTSLMLAGRELGVDGRRAIDLSEVLLEAYVGAVFHRRRPPAPPALIAKLIDRVRSRTRRELLDARTEVVRGERRFIRGPRYETLAPKLRAKAERAFAKYARRLPRADRVPDHALEVIDAAFRVAGTGSLGCLRVALLVRGKGGRDGAWVFDMKSEGAPSSARLVPAPPLEPADRVVAAIGACLSRPPRMIGTTRLRGESMFVRRLTPQEDKLQLTGLAAERPRPARAASRRPARRGAQEGREEAPPAGLGAGGPRGDPRARHHPRGGPRGAVPRVLPSGPPVKISAAEAFFDAIAGRYERVYALSSTESRRRMDRVLGDLPPPPARILDLGVGTGRELTALLDAGHLPTGVDASRAMLERCARRARPVPLVHADFWATPLPFAAGSFEAVDRAARDARPPAGRRRRGPARARPRSRHRARRGLHRRGPFTRMADARSSGRRRTGATRTVESGERALARGCTKIGSPARRSRPSSSTRPTGAPRSRPIGDRASKPSMSSSSMSSLAGSEALP